MEAQIANTFQSSSNSHQLNQGNLDTNLPLFCYPNPFKDEMKIVLDLPESVKGLLQVHDVFGKKLIEKEHTFMKGKNIQTLYQLSELPEGLLFISIKTENKIYTAKVSKFN